MLPKLRFVPKRTRLSEALTPVSSAFIKLMKLPVLGGVRSTTSDPARLTPVLRLLARSVNQAVMAVVLV